MTLMRCLCTVQNPQGIHCRVATKLAGVSASFDAVVEIVTEADRVVVSSILDVLSLGLGLGKEVCLEARGPDADRALEAVKDVLCHPENP